MEDTLCRFLDPARWSQDDNRPTYQAFSASNKKLSTWHKGRVAQNGSALEELCFDSLKGFGEGLLNVGEVIQAAEHSSSPNFEPFVVFRPDEVEEPRSRWREAHANIESEAGNDRFPRDYRLLLAMKCYVSRRPDGI